MNSLQESKVIVFDFDKTLTCKDTHLQLIHFAAFHDRILLLKLPFYYLMMVLNKIRVIKNDTLKSFSVWAFLRKLNEINSEEFFNKFSRTIQLSGIAKELCRHNNERIFVISASIENYIRPIFPNRIEVLGSKINFNSKGRLFLELNLFSEKKLKTLRELGIKEIDILYTDSKDDLPLASIAKKIYLVKDQGIKMYNYNEFLDI